VDAFAHVVTKIIFMAAAAGVLALANSRRRIRDASGDVYAFHPVVALLCYGAAGLAAYAIAASKAMDRSLDGSDELLTGILLGVTLLFVLAGAYFQRYRVRFDGASLEYGAFVRRGAPLPELIDYDVLPSELRRLLLYLRDGRRPTVSGLIGDFDALVADVAAHCRRYASGATPDCAQKLRDRRRRALNARLKWVYLAIPVVLVCIAVWLLARS
jgi:hypothetical protein